MLVADDFSFGLERKEVRCKNCSQHLGYLLDDTSNGRLLAFTKGKRRKIHVILSAALEFQAGGSSGGSAVAVKEAKEGTPVWLYAAGVAAVAVIGYGVYKRISD